MNPQVKWWLALLAVILVAIRASLTPLLGDHATLFKVGSVSLLLLAAIAFITGLRDARAPHSGRRWFLGVAGIAAVLAGFGTWGAGLKAGDDAARKLRFADFVEYASAHAAGFDDVATYRKHGAVTAQTTVRAGTQPKAETVEPTLDPWPFTVQSVTLRCRLPIEKGVGMVTATTEDGREFALNGTARSRYPDVRPIWQADLDGAGPRVILSATNAALALCLGPGNADWPLRVVRRQLPDNAELPTLRRGERLVGRWIDADVGYALVQIVETRSGFRLDMKPTADGRFALSHILVEHPVRSGRRFEDREGPEPAFWIIRPDGKLEEKEHPDDPAWVLDPAPPDMTTRAELAAAIVRRAPSER